MSRCPRLRKAVCGTHRCAIVNQTITNDKRVIQRMIMTRLFRRCVLATSTRDGEKLARCYHQSHLQDKKVKATFDRTEHRYGRPGEQQQPQNRDPPQGLRAETATPNVRNPSEPATHACRCHHKTISFYRQPGLAHPF